MIWRTRGLARGVIPFKQGEDGNSINEGVEATRDEDYDQSGGEGEKDGVAKKGKHGVAVVVWLGGLDWSVALEVVRRECCRFLRCACVGLGVVMWTACKRLLKGVVRPYLMHTLLELVSPVFIRDVF